jgi:hypothetical protein
MVTTLHKLYSIVTGSQVEDTSLLRVTTIDFKLLHSGSYSILVLSSLHSHYQFLFNSFLFGYTIPFFF